MAEHYVQVFQPSPLRPGPGTGAPRLRSGARRSVTCGPCVGRVRAQSRGGTQAARARRADGRTEEKGVGEARQIHSPIHKCMSAFLTPGWRHACVKGRGWRRRQRWGDAALLGGRWDAGWGGDGEGEGKEKSLSIHAAWLTLTFELFTNP